jgi:hypothetical protein
MLRARPTGRCPWAESTIATTARASNRALFQHRGRVDTRYHSLVVGQSLPRWFLLPIGLALAAAIAWVATHWLGNDRANRSAVARSDASGLSTRDRDESELLDQAEAALARGEADDALTHVERHASDFPHSSRADDRTLLRVRALCALEREDEAAAMIDDIRRARPEAAVLDRLGETCVAR